MKVSEALGVSSSVLWECGVFDSYLGIDSRLHIDPALLRRSRTPEFRESWQRFEQYFDAVFVFLRTATPGGRLEKQAIDRLVFPEVNLAALGYSGGRSQGRGVSRALATELYHTSREIVNAGINDAAIFELAIIFEEGFGPDLISDMTLWIILEDVSEFNKRVCAKLQIATRKVTLGGRKIVAAYSELEGKSILLLPRAILADLPVATDYEDIGRVALYNKEIRESLSRVLGGRWKQLVKNLGKRQLKELLLRDTQLLKDLLKAYKDRQAIPYDFVVDPLGEIVWETLAKREALANALNIESICSPDDIPRVVQAITKQFKHIVEQCGGHKHLYDDGGNQRPEKFAQLLFYGIADAYCKANNLDLNAEPNAGRGPVDFKMSRGYHGRAVVEIKLSSNGRGLDGLLAQLPVYARSEQANYSCFVLVVVGRNKRKVDAIVAEHNRCLTEGKLVPDLIVINAHEAHIAPSASRLRRPR